MEYQIINATWIIMILLQLTNFVKHGNAVAISICPDLVSKPLSIMEIDVTHPLFGAEYNTIESLTSSTIENDFQHVYNNSCTAECIVDLECRLTVRSLFLDALAKFADKSGLYHQHMAYEPANFTTYQDKLVSSWSVITKNLFTSSCVSMCNALINQPDSKLQFDCMCDNPCKHQSSCPQSHCQALGIFEHQYRCKCDVDQVWDTETYLCLPTELHKALRGKLPADKKQLYDDSSKCGEDSDCDPMGTLHCYYSSTSKQFRCFCRAHYKGARCNELIDTCEAFLPGPFNLRSGPPIEGNRACNVNQRDNYCQSYISADGDMYYRCKCSGLPWIPDPAIPFDNCLKRRTVCDSAICVHGDCYATETGSHAYCLCHQGYSGVTCEKWVGVWSEWSPWDACRPKCGDVRYSVRTRNCLSLNSNLTHPKGCLGASVEYAKCAEHICSNLEGNFVDTYFDVRQDALAASIATAAIGCAMITLTWFFFFWGLVSQIMRRFLYRILHLNDRPIWTRPGRIRKQTFID